MVFPFCLVIFLPFNNSLAFDYGLSTSRSVGSNISAFGSIEGSSVSTLLSRTGSFIGVILSFVGIIFMALLIYGGFLWMTASGNDQQIDKSKKVIIWSSIGMVSLFASFAAVQFIGEQATRPINEDVESALEVTNSFTDFEGDWGEGLFNDLDLGNVTVTEEEFRAYMIEQDIKDCIEKYSDYINNQYFCRCGYDDVFRSNNPGACQSAITSFLEQGLGSLPAN